MKNLIEFLFEAISEYDKLMTSIHEPNNGYTIKHFILDKGIYKVLNILGRNGAPMRNKSINWKQKWKTTSKRKTEYARGEFGRTPENFVNNLNYIFNNILGLDKNDYIIEEPQLNRNVSSNSKLSSKIIIDFNIDSKNYHDEFYICDTQLSASGKEILISDKILLPTNVIVPNKKYTNTESLLSDIETNLKNNFKGISEGDQYVNLIMNLTKSILNNDNNKGIISIRSLLDLKEKQSYDYIINDNDFDSQLFKSLDNTSKNNIVVIFGEILAGLILMNITDDFKEVMWPGNNERINDLYFNGIGISIKRKNSAVGHLPEVSSIANVIIKALNDLEIDDNDNISISKLNDIRKKLNLKDITLDKLKQFKSDLSTFYNIDNSKKSREDILWDACWSVLKNDTNFKQLLKLLNITSRNQCTESNILNYMTDLSVSKRNSIIDHCINMADVKNVDSISKVWYDNPTNSKERESNYSKIMRGLQLKLCDELNKRYTSDNDTSDLFSVFVSNALKSMQCYIDITAKNDIVLKFSIENMQNGKYIFKPAGSTWSEWKSHGNIGFKIR